MSALTAAPLRLLSFADPDGAVWGGLVQAGSVAAFGCGASQSGEAGGAVALSAEGQIWAVSGDGVELQITPAGSPSLDGPGGDELCHVEGTVTIGGEARAVACPGVRTVDPGLEDATLQSLRGMTAAFADDRALTLCALRPARAHGNEDDAVAATVFDPDQTHLVEDPRLSTTYAADGHPTRASLELWIASGEDLLSRRAAGEAAGGPVSAAADGLTLQVTPLRCHAGGLDGSGVYLLASF